MPDSKEDILAQKLDTLIRLQAFGLVSRFESQKEKILFLRKVGMQNKEIADLLGTSANTVNVTIVKAKKAEQKKSPTKDEGDGEGE